MTITTDTSSSTGPSTKAESWFIAAEYVPPDAIFALTAQYLKDPSLLKVNLGQGTYRDHDGKPWVLPSVRQAREQLLTEGLDHEYLPILGLHDFRERAAETVLGSVIYAERENVSSSLRDTMLKYWFLMSRYSLQSVKVFLVQVLCIWWDCCSRHVDDRSRKSISQNQHGPIITKCSNR